MPKPTVSPNVACSKGAVPTQPAPEPKRTYQGVDTVKAPLTLEPRYVRIPDAARLLGISRSKLYEAIARGEIRRIRWGGVALIAVADLRVPGDGA